MPIGFPSSPTVGQQWPAVSPRWQWDGAKWVAIAGTAGGLTATPITDTITTLAGSDSLIALRGGVPYLATLAAVQAFVGGTPSATAPEAFAVGQWTATAGTELIEINVTALPADGGSAITALQYRVNGGAAVTMTGVGLGIRQITGLTGGVQASVQLRAVNAIGAGAWGDTKNATPTAAGGGGSGEATWLATAATEGSIGPFSNTVPAKPAGTQATDLLVMTMTSITPTVLADLTVPAGWTLAGTAFSNLDSNGMAVFTAAGNVADAAWLTGGSYVTGFFNMHRISGANLAAPVRAFVQRQSHVEFSLGTADMPTPSATATAGDVVLSHYFQAQSATAVGTPQAGYTRVVDGGTLTRWSTLQRSNAPAGATGDISHNASAAWEARVGATIVLAAA